MNIDEARAFVESGDRSDAQKMVEAVATVLRFEGIANPEFVRIANELERLAPHFADKDKP